MRKCVTLWGLMTMMNYDLYLHLTVIYITYILISLLITEIRCEYTEYSVGNKDMAEFPDSDSARSRMTTSRTSPGLT